MKKFIIYIVIFILSFSGCSNISQVSDEQITIGEIQGCGHVSPINGFHVFNVQGIVTHKFSNGFSMQSAINDDLECSSEGIFVATDDFPKVELGQLVSVEGNVVEYTAGNETDNNLSRTEIHRPIITVISQGNKFLEPVVFDKLFNRIPAKAIKLTTQFDTDENGLDFFESLEFMLVQIDDGVVVGPKNEYNEFFVLPKNFINLNKLSSQNALLKSETDENPEKIMIDAATSFTQRVNVGDELLQPIVGIMDYSFANYKIWTISNPVIKRIDNQNTEININDSLLTIATYNLENFTRFDKSSRIKKIGCQIVKVLRSPDILILNEVLDDSGIQDDGTISSDETLKVLVSSISNCGGPDYLISDNPPIDGMDGGVDGGNIRTAVIYKDDQELRLEEPNESINGLVFENNLYHIGKNPLRLFVENPTYSGTRKPTIWLFRWKEEQFLIMGVHLLSQSANSPDWGKIHPISMPDQAKREKQSGLLSEYFSQTGLMATQPNIIIAGDFNDYEWSNTLRVLKSTQILAILSDKQPEENYSYIHEGNAFEFDYVFVNQKLLTRIKQFSIPHINTIMNSEDQVSDHDPVLVTIMPLD